MSGSHVLEIERTLGLIPGAPAIMTAGFENKRAGVLVGRFMRCSDEPPCVAVAVPKGHRISTLIRDSHTFGLCLLDRSQRLLMRRFEPAADPGLIGGGGTDTFDTLDVRVLATGAPILARAVAALDCDVMRHFDLEADHEVYVGQVLAACVLNPTQIGAGSSTPDPRPVGSPVTV